MRPARPLRAAGLLSLALLACPSASALAQSAGASTEPNPAAPATTVADHVTQASLRFGVPERWIWAVMRAESNGDPGAVSSAGAMGLMQIMPGTWAYLRVRYQLGNDPFDRRDNILGGTAYLREMHDRYGAPGFLAAYNAGPGRYDDYLARGRPLPSATRAYVAQLAPAIGAPGLPPTAVATLPDRDAWARAALFPQRPDDHVADDVLAASAPEREPPPPREDRPLAPRDAIFVALSGQHPQ